MSTTPSEASAVKASIGRQVAFGAVWVMAGAMAGKAVGLGVQVVLGWVLVPEDFAIYASALGLNLVAAALLDGGTERFLLRSGDSYGRVIVASTRIAYLANGLAGLAVLGIAAWAWWWRGDAVLAGVLGVMAVHAATRTPVSMLRTRLRHAMRFGTVVRTEVVAMVFRGVLSAVLAMSGLGAFAFVVPLIASLPLEWALLARQVNCLPQPICDRRAESVRTVLRSTRWIVAANSALTLAARGDYLALTIAAPQVLGVYFFGFQLALASMQLFMVSFRSVLLPGLSRVGDDPARLRSATRRAIRTTNLVLPPVCACLALISPVLVHLVWKGRWDDSIVVIQAVALSTAFRAASPVAFSLMEARARWVRVAVLNVLDGLTLMATVFLAVWWSGADVASIVWLVALQRALIGVVIQSSALGLIRVGAVQSIRWLGSGMLATGIGLATAAAFGTWPDATNTDLGSGVTGVGLFGLGWTLFVAIFERDQIRWIVTLLRRRRGGAMDSNDE
jgi:O-antigen/teichoic acid export membrane protein